MHLEVSLGCAALVAVACVLQFASNRGTETRQVLLGHEVVGARPEDGDRGLFIDRPGDDDEGKVELLLMKAAKGAHRAELRQRVVADHQVPLRGDERRPAVGRALDANGFDLKPGGSKSA